jgi:propanediol dehydratase small subunit
MVCGVIYAQMASICRATKHPLGDATPTWTKTASIVTIASIILKQRRVGIVTEAYVHI